MAYVNMHLVMRMCGLKHEVWLPILQYAFDSESFVDLIYIRVVSWTTSENL